MNLIHVPPIDHLSKGDAYDYSLLLARNKCASIFLLVSIMGFHLDWNCSAIQINWGSRDSIKKITKDEAKYRIPISKYYASFHENDWSLVCRKIEGTFTFAFRILLCYFGNCLCYSRRECRFISLYGWFLCTYILATCTFCTLFLIGKKTRQKYIII